MKKLIWMVIVVVLMTGLIFTGCAQPAPTTTPTTPTPAPTTPTPAPAQPAEVIKWVGQCPLAGGIVYDVFVRFAEKVTEATGGRMELTAHPAGAVVPGTKEFDGVNDGVLHYAKSSISYLRDRYPAASILGFTVGGLSAIETVVWYREGGGKELCQRMIQGTNVRADFINEVTTAETFLWSNKPLKTAGDIKGLKIRTAGDDGVMFSRMGAAVVGMPPAETYESMQRGVIDAFQLGAPTTDFDLAMYEVAKYCYLSPERQPLEFSPLFINADAWAKLTPDLQEIIKLATAHTVMESYAQFVTQDIETIAKLKAGGTIIEPASADIVAELKRQADIYYGELAAKDAFVAEVYNSKMNFMKACRETWPRL